MHPAVLSARLFAQEAHKDQTRKYTGEPYFNHCEEVAQLVEEYGGTAAQIAAAYLHDVVEDTPVTDEQIDRKFGFEISHLVWCLTDQSKPEDGNRATRKEIDRYHLAKAPAGAQTIKLADLISNTRTIVRYDPDFAKVYLREKMSLLNVMTKGDRRLYSQARKLAFEGMVKLGLL